MPPGKGVKEVRVGALVALSVVIFAVAVMAISRESRLFAPKVRYWTLFKNTSGLTEGSPVRLVGVQIGTVEEIAFHQDPRESKIRVEFAVARQFRGRLRTGTLAFLKSLTYLSQDKYIELVPGDPDGDELEPRAFIEPGRSIWEETLRRGESIADDVKEITAGLRDFLIAVNRGGGLIQEMIHNPEFGRKGVSDFEKSLSTLEKMLASIEQGEGLAGMLLSNREFAAEQRENIDSALDHLQSAMKRLDSNDGWVAQLEDPDGRASRVLSNLEEVVDSFRRLAEKLEEGEGLAARLITDDEFATSVMEKIENAASHAESILEKIDRGEGTLGGIINDPEVHEGLKDIVAGIRKSRMGKGLIRHYEKKGLKERERQEKEEAEQKSYGPTP